MKNLNYILLLLCLLFSSCNDDDVLAPTFQQLIEGDWDLFSFEVFNCVEDSSNVSLILATDGCLEINEKICNTLSFDSNGILTSTEEENVIEDTFTYITAEDSSIVFICDNTIICSKMYYENEKLISTSINSGCDRQVIYIKK